MSIKLRDKNKKVILEFALVPLSELKSYQQIISEIDNTIDHNKVMMGSRTIMFTDGNDSNEKIIKQIDNHIDNIQGIPRIYFAGEYFTDLQVVEIMKNIEFMKDKLKPN